PQSAETPSASRQRPHIARFCALPPDRTQLSAHFSRACRGRARYSHVSMAKLDRHVHYGCGAADPLFERTVVDLRAALSAPFALGGMAARPWPVHPPAVDAACARPAHCRECAGRLEPLWLGAYHAMAAIAVAWGFASGGS